MDSRILNDIKRVLESREKLYKGIPDTRHTKAEDEGGCGVTGFACTIPVAGRHIYAPSVQMHNRGNGKGGGIAAVGLIPEEMGVDRETLDTHYMLQVAVLDDSVISEIDKDFIFNNFNVAHSYRQETIDDWRDMKTLLVRPPDVHRYFVRVKPDVLDTFAAENGMSDMDRDYVEDEFVFQNSFRINSKYYASLGEKRAFVMSHGRNMFIMKIVGYAEESVEYYRLSDKSAHVWIAHQRYPTKGRVWHPAGAHPFMGMDEALVHNGDFANYYSVAEYLQQRHIRPLFLTDTEVSILVFDLLNRVYKYPTEYIIESLAPTTEMDFDMLPEEKKKIYRAIQATQVHGSPDGPWLFIIARNLLKQKQFQLLGITDTAMLRPQVFAIQNNDVQIGLVCSEKQAIDATLQSLANEDPRFSPVADKYWNARGGSYENGGAFSFTISDDESSPTGKKLVCADKFGNELKSREDQRYLDISLPVGNPNGNDIPPETTKRLLAEKKVDELAELVINRMADCGYDVIRRFLDGVVEFAEQDDVSLESAIEVLTCLNDKTYPLGDKKRSSILTIVQKALYEIFKAVPGIRKSGGSKYKLVDWESREAMRAPAASEKVLIINAHGFQPELDERDSKLIVRGYELGWRRFIVFNSTGQRFHGVGLGPDTDDVRIDCYGSSGDYLGSGIDGLEIYVHGDGQDQIGQIMKSGRMVVYGSVGQTFMYGAKGGEVYIKGNAAGRPLINAVGKPRVVINGTCLDYLAESFMAGDPLRDGGFVVLNGLEYNEYGVIQPLNRPYSGSNLFSLASGGAIYIRDPHRLTVDVQLNGGEFKDFTEADWAVILPYLKENERLFGISIENDLLTVEGVKKSPLEIYRKVGAVKIVTLAKENGGTE
ncbi:MAG TPA: glutamate synthase [bacterium]|nr:glutamate synthase [bacterium]